MSIRASVLVGRSGVLWYAPVLGIAMALMMARMLIMARLLAVNEFAVFSGGVLVSSSFCMLGCVGLQSLLQRELPMNLVRRQERRGIILSAQCVLVALACFIVLQLLAALGISFGSIPPRLLAAGSLHGLSQQMFLIATVDSRSRGEALRFAGQNLGRAVPVVLLGAVTALISGSAVAVLLGEAVVTIGLSVLMMNAAAEHSALNVGQICHLAARRMGNVNWRAAVTLMAVSALAFALLSADRWLASGALTAIGFAGYSFAGIVLLVAQSVQLIINASTYPLLARTYAKAGASGAFSVCVKYSGAILICGLVAVVPTLLLIRYLISRWFPLYDDAMALMPIFLFIAVLRVSDFWTSYLLIVGREARLLWVNAWVAAGSFGAWAILVRLWATPMLRPHDVALLAATLSTFGYGAVVAMAWKSRVRS
jgi:O-antigen/teichoic acid export membrane protein